MSELADACSLTKTACSEIVTTAAFLLALIGYVLEYNYIFIGLVSNLVPTLPVAIHSRVVICAAHRPFIELLSLIPSNHPLTDKVYWFVEVFSHALNRRG